MVDLNAVDEFIEVYDGKVLPFLKKTLALMGSEDKEKATRAEEMFDNVSGQTLSLMRKYIKDLEKVEASYG